MRLTLIPTAALLNLALFLAPMAAAEDSDPDPEVLRAVSRTEATHRTRLARIATLVERLREKEPNCLLFDNGDTLQGTPLGDVVQEQGLTAPHPMIAAMNRMRYDAATVGNHDCVA